MWPKYHLVQVLLCFHILGLYRYVNSLDYIKLNNDETEWPLRYKDNEEADTIATWMVTAPEGRRLVLRCRDISLPKSVNCTNGRLLIIEDEKIYTKVCSQTSSYTKVSPGHLMTVELYLRRNYDGQVKCQVRLLRTVQDPADPGLNQPLQTSCPCGRRNESHIVRPEEAGIEEFPYAVHLKQRDSHKAICGGSILTERHILTAASCILTPGNKKREGLRVGVGHIRALDGDIYSDLTFKVQKIHDHKGYNPQNFPRNDIALLELKENIKFNELLRPVCLPRVPYNLDKIMLSTLGRSSTIKKVNFIVDDSESCVNSQNREEHLQQNPTEHCIRQQDQETCKKSGSPTCGKVDTGTPLLYWDTKLLRYVQVGFFLKQGDDSTPSTFVEVFPYFEWIQNKIGLPPTKLERLISSLMAASPGLGKREKSPVYTCEQLEHFLLPHD